VLDPWSTPELNWLEVELEIINIGAHSKVLGLGTRKLKFRHWTVKNKLFQRLAKRQKLLGPWTNQGCKNTLHFDKLFEFSCTYSKNFRMCFQ